MPWNLILLRYRTVPGSVALPNYKRGHFKQRIYLLSLLFFSIAWKLWEGSEGALEKERKKEDSNTVVNKLMRCDDKSRKTTISPVLPPFLFFPKTS
ncbi:uncharacterized protein BO97DRAFT_40846 [Aspergillus homomorphus CBS 101889]|uniref:Uncharacterized protein n=1 Tax=Aspergillus homomorphus (strain CBS 101889) TaxID=1450537 RepID=A0A395I128_ASPHC|nr:hypothetical protein BO97DRAFT_40846 [Aspergillus homomorphus CBS 101889]RAL13506.1 hypothetical protein BO97DRAFT_40846 [Aspergillus homomorphus CBS 101889]